jgi:glycosyltransferase involved in cell wall biosynthesis
LKIVFLLRNNIKNRIGGSEYQANLLGNYLKTKYGHEVIHIFEDNDLHSGKYHLKNYGSNRYSILNYYRLKKYLKEIQPDILYQRCNNIYSFLSYYISKRMNIGGIYHFASDNDYSYKISNPGSVVRYYSIKHTDSIIVQTKFQYDKLEGFRGNKKQMYNSLEISNDKSLEKEDIITWIGNIKPVKGLERLIPLARLYNNSSIKFLVIGKDSDSNYSRNILNKIEKVQNIIYLGYQNLDEVNKILQKSKFFINTSISEGFPNTYLQSWNNGVPTISLNIDPDNIIMKNDIGYVSNDYKKLHKYINRLINDENIYNKVSKRSKEYVIENHDIEKNIEILHNIMLSTKKIDILK